MSAYTKKIIILSLLSFIFILYFGNYYLSEMTSQHVATILSYFIGVSPIVEGSTLFLIMNNHIVPIFISFECTGFAFYVTILIIMFMMPKISLKHRFLSLLILPYIYFANIVRILIGIFIGIYTDTYKMSLFHDTLGQLFLLFSSVYLLLMFLDIYGYIQLRRVFKYDIYYN